MANTATNVTAGKPKVGGAIYRAPIGTTLPTDATTALDNAFVCLGYVSEDGLTNDNSPESEDIKAWGGDIVYSAETEKTDTFQFTLIEATNVNVLKHVYGDDNVTQANGSITIRANSTPTAYRSYVIESILRDGTAKRVVIPSAKVTSVGDIVYKDDTLHGYDTTITAVADTAGNTHYEYIGG